MFIPDYIEQTCLDHPDLACQAMEEITQFTSCEFAVRPFIIKYPKMMMQRMQKWATHEHPHVRRFASEGCRPRLPWAMAIDFLKRNPAPILPILDRLKDDPSVILNDAFVDDPFKYLTLKFRYINIKTILVLFIVFIAHKFFPKPLYILINFYDPFLSLIKV